MRRAADPTGQETPEAGSEPETTDSHPRLETIDGHPGPETIDDRPEPDAIDDRLEYYEDMTVWRVPLIDWPISVNKVHAIVYGLVGYYVGALSVHEPVVALTLAIALNLGAMGIWIVDVSRIERIGIETIKYKPHYFVVPFLLTFLIGRYLI